MNRRRTDYILPIWFSILLWSPFLFSQQEAPVFHKPPALATPGEDLEITLSFYKPIPVREGKLYFRAPGQVSFHELEMLPNNLSWTGTIPGDKITEDGIEYVIAMVMINGGIIGFPEKTPFENPLFVAARPGRSTGRSFPGAVYSTPGTSVEADYLILTPEPESIVRPEDIVISLSFFNAPLVDTSSIKLYIDQDEFTNLALVSNGIINLVVDYLKPGYHTIRVESRTVFGRTIEPFTWSFNVEKSGFNLKEQMIYSGEATSLASTEFDGDVSRNTFELSGKSELGVSWIGTRSKLRFTTRESPYLQPYNRFSTDILFGDYLTLQFGDFFPTMNPYTINGRRVRGLGILVRLPWFKFYSVTGALNRSVQWRGVPNQGYVFRSEDIKYDTLGTVFMPLDRTGFTFDRTVRAYQLVVNPVSKFYLGLHFLKAIDDTKSVNRYLPRQATFSVDSLITPGTYTYDRYVTAVQAAGAQINFPADNWSGPAPQDNIVGGLELATTFDDDKMRLSFDLNMSMFNRNIWRGPMTLAELDTALDDSLDGLIGVNYDENGLVMAGSMMIDTLNLIDPVLYEKFFTLNQYMTPLVPIDIDAYKDTPWAAILNMPSTAWGLQLTGTYRFNTFTIDYHQVGPEFISLGNPFLVNNVREFTLKNRLKLFDNKMIISFGYQHRDNKILRSAVDPLNTNTLSASFTLIPGVDSPTLMFNINSIGKNNEKDELDIIGSTIVDSRENSNSVNSTLALTFPFDLPTATHNLVVNYNSVINTDLFRNRRRADYIFPKTDTKSYVLNVSSRYASSLRTSINTSFTTLSLPTLDAEGEVTSIPFTWTAASVQGAYPLMEKRLRLAGGLNWMRSKGTTTATIYGLQSGGDYTLTNNVLATVSTDLKIMHTREFKNDGIDNDGNNKIDEFMESWSLNSFVILLKLGYRF